MGLIKAAVGSVTGTLRDQFQDVVEPVSMGAQTLFVQGRVRGKKGFSSSDVISNGSVIHVYDNMFMILVDGGKIIDYSAEPGYFIVDNSSQPSLFQGQFKESLKEAWERFKFGGGTGLLYQHPGDQGHQVRDTQSCQLFRQLLQCGAFPPRARHLFGQGEQSASVLCERGSEECRSGRRRRYQ